MTALLDVHDLTVRFPARKAPLVAVRDVSFAIAPGEVLGLVGESGSGKSLTALALMRLLPPQAEMAGAIRFEGRDLAAASDDAMRRLRGAQIAMIFQEPMTALNPVMRVGDQVAEAVMAHGEEPALIESLAGPRDFKSTRVGRLTLYSLRVQSASVSRREAWARAVEALRVVGIEDAERRARDYPHQLSGGQRQRVMIAMAVVNRPQLLIADEPTTALDVTIQAQILDLLAELREKFALAMLLISHDLAVVSRVAHRVAVMYCGNIVEMADTAAIFRAAAHPYTRGLLRSVPTLRTERSQPLPAIEGTVPPLAALPPGCPFEPRCELRVAECARALPPLVEVAPKHWARCPVANPLLDGKRRQQESSRTGAN